ncbi:MAG: prepilin peptidase [Novosphingobium sp.]
MTAGVASYGLVAGLAIALLTAAATDLRRREIDNRLNAAVALAAPLFWWASGLPLWPGVVLQIGCASIMLLLLAALFAMGLMGGGDVKLLTALALWLPWRPFLELIVVMAVAGGALTLVLAVWHHLRRRRDRLQIPYGVAIAGAGLWVLGAHFAP